MKKTASTCRMRTLLFSLDNILLIAKFGTILEFVISQRKRIRYERILNQ